MSCEILLLMVSSVILVITSQDIAMKSTESKKYMKSMNTNEVRNFYILTTLLILNDN